MKNKNMTNVSESRVLSPEDMTLSHHELRQILGGARAPSYTMPTDNNGRPIDPKDLPWDILY